MSDLDKAASSYTVVSSINEPQTYAHMQLTPISINEAPVNPPAPPTLTSLVPNTAVAGSGNVTVHIMGTGFGDWSSVVFNGAERAPTSFVSNTDLTILVRTTGMAQTSYPVRVKNGQYQSNALNLTLT